jgi:hypothetical protein
VPIVSGDILHKLSITSGAAGYAAAQPDPNASLGKYISTTDMPSNLFDTISGTENAASTVDYRCMFVLNNHATLTYYNAVAYISGEVASGASIAIAVDNIAASTKTSAPAQAAVIANETTAPTGVGAFSSPTTAATGLALGDIGPGQCRAVWIRRTAANTAALDADGVTLQTPGDTAQ